MPNEPIYTWDWSHFLAKAESLRIYAFEHGTIPIWNFMLCGGKPALADPQDYSFTWVSLFFYVLPPVVAIQVIWAVMAILGVALMTALLEEHGVPRWAAGVGALLFCANGYFSAHYHVGHLTFAFFPLIVGIMLGVNFALQSVSHRRGLVFVAVFGFLLLTGGMPAAVFYFAPAALLYTGFRFLSLDRPWRQLVHVALVALLTAFASAYKILPPLLWDSGSGREIYGESYSLFQVFSHLVNAVSDPVWGLQATDLRRATWEYQAFVGWPAVVVALATIGWGVGRRGRISRPWRCLVNVGLATILLGGLLSIGNEASWGLGQFFARFPVLSAIRVFSRYQVLIVFGVAVLCALGLGVCDAAMRRYPRFHRRHRGLLKVLGVGLLFPVLYQTANFIATERTVAAKVVERVAGVPAPASLPLLVDHQVVRGRGTQFKTDHLILQTGHWVKKCYDALKVVTNPRASDAVTALSEPPPVGYQLGHSSLQLKYDLLRPADIRLYLNDSPWLSYDPPLNDQGVVTLGSGQRKILITANVPWFWSSVATGVGALILLGWFIYFYAAREGG